MPFQVLGIWLRGLLAVVLLGVAVFLLRDWYQHRWSVKYDVPIANVPGSDSPQATPQRKETTPAADTPGTSSAPASRWVEWHFGANRPTASLLGGLALLLYGLGGGWIGRLLPAGTAIDPPPKQHQSPTQRLPRPDGTELAVECSGPEDAPVLLLTHGWGLNRSAWTYARKQLEDRYRIISWDLPGLGESRGPQNRDWSMEKMAGDLRAVLTLAGDRPIILVGHSIGGMIILTFCRLFPELLGTQVRGLVLTHTTYTNPTRTTSMSALYTAIQRPVLIPLCHLMIWLAPLVWIMNLLSYLNGSAHRSTEQNSFSGNESRGQLDFMTLFILQAWPAVLARGFLAMFQYDAIATLNLISVPALIVAGSDDPVCKPEASNFMVAHIQQARGITLQPAKHCGHFEHHAQYASAVAEFAAAALQEPVSARTRPGA